MKRGNSGPLERAWRARGFRIMEIEGLQRPWVVTRQEFVPCAFLPLGVAGEEREDQFARLLLELELRQTGWSQLVARLAEYAPAP